MSLFTSISNLSKSLKNLVSVAKPELTTAKNLYPSVINTITSLPTRAEQALAEKVVKQTFSSQVASSLKSTIANNPIKSTVIGGAAAFSAVPVATGLVSGTIKPQSAFGSIYEAEKLAIKTASGKATKEDFVGFVKQNPISTAVVSLGTALVAGKAVGGLIGLTSSALNKSATSDLAESLAGLSKAQNDAKKTREEISLPTIDTNKLPTPRDITPDTSPNLPTVRPTTELAETGSGSIKRKRKSAKKKKSEQVSQIRINNYMINDSYLKKSSYNY